MALYHKHRPQKFSEVIGQDHIVQTLSNQVASGKTAHAYLFSGPRGVGKTTAARILAKAVNCINRKESNPEPCNSCNSCLEISISRSIDVIEIDAASHTGVDNVRENIIENAQFRPTKSKYKIFIIDEVHMLSTSSFNALLKILEEPPEHVIFILATTEKHKLPETIISRCQRFDFKKIPYEMMKKHLETVAKGEGIKIDKEVLERIIRKSEGCVRDGVNLLDQIIASGEKHITVDTASIFLPVSPVERTLEFAISLVKKELKETLIFLSRLSEDGISFPAFAQDTVEFMRLMLVSKAGGPNESYGQDISNDVRKAINKLNQCITCAELVRLIDLLLNRSQQIKSSPLPQLPLEMAAVEWCESTNCENTNNTKSGTKNTSDNKSEDKKEAREIKIDKKEQPEIKKTISERVKELISKNPSFTIDEVNGKWKEFFDQIESRFPSLSFILKMASVRGVDGNTLQLAVNYGFHQEKLMEKNCRRKLEEILSETLQTKAKLEIILEENTKLHNQKNELEEIASSFGGEIIN